MIKTALIGMCMVACTTVKAQNKLEWQHNYKLTIEDFQAPAPNTGSIQTVYAHVGIEYQFANYELIGSRNFNGNVSNYFFRNASWLDEGERTNTLLRYAQSIFDIHEWMSRELRKRFLENRKMMASGRQNEIYEGLVAEFSEIQSRYSKETNYAEDAEMQQEWELMIKAKLDDLSAYCKVCKPPKRKK